MLEVFINFLVVDKNILCGTVFDMIGKKYFS